MWQSRQCCFYWIHYVDRHFILSFISYSLWPERTCINWQLRLMLLFPRLRLRYTVRYMLFVSALVRAHAVSDLSRKYVSWAVSLVLLLKWLHRTEIKKSPFTSCVISSWEVLISYRASDTSYLAGRLTCKGIFRLDSSNECGTQAITWPTLHMEEEKSHLSFCDFHFHLCSLPAHSFLPLLFLSPGNYHQPCQEPCRMEGEKCVTLPLKFLIV